MGGSRLFSVTNNRERHIGMRVQVWVCLEILITAVQIYFYIMGHRPRSETENIESNFEAAAIPQSTGVHPHSLAWR